MFLFGGLVAWAAHFVGVYAIASIADVMGDAASPGSRAAIGGLTLLCALADVVLIVVAWRGWSAAMPPGDAEMARFWRSVGGAAAVISLTGVLWQGLPALLA